MINVLLVEDKKMSRDCMEGYIKNSSKYRLSASISNAGMAEMTCMKLPVDIILMDVCTDNNESGLDATEKIKRNFPHIKVVVVTSMADAEFLERARTVGAESFWYKEASVDELLDVMDKTMNGESIYPDKAPDIQIGNTTSDQFTPGDLEVLRYLVKGLKDADIANEMHISVSAVRWHIKELFEKTGYNNRVTLACDVINKDLIVPGF